MRRFVNRMGIVACLVTAGLVSAEQVSFQPKSNNYTGYTQAEIKGYDPDVNETVMWELKLGNCVT